MIYSYQLGGDGAGARVPDGEISGLLKSDTLAWAHLHVGHTETLAFLKDTLSGLDPSVLRALMADETRPRATEIGDGLLVILRGINSDKEESEEDLVSVRLWIDARRIISMQRKKLQAVKDMAAIIEDGRGPSTPGRFLAELVENLTRRMEPVLTLVDDETDAIEERLIDGGGPELRNQLLELRRRTIALRRYLGPQRDALNLLANGRMAWLSDGDRRALHENHDRLQRMVEDLDALRERAQLVKDELANTMADRMNRNMYILSIIGSIFLPLGFLTGLMGINIGGMPGAESGAAFWVFTGLLAVFVAIELALFRYLKWI